MRLAENQIEFYKQEGYLVIEDILDSLEIQKCKSALDTFENMKELPNVIFDDDGKIRSVFAPDKYQKIFEDIYRDERFSGPSRQLIDSDIYLYQYKLNIKKPFAKQIWEWHQDFPYWKIDDGVPSPDMLSIMVYLSDAMSYQGPLTIIPRSHTFDIVDFQKKDLLQNSDAPLINSLGADLKYTINELIISKLADEFGIKVLEFRAGTAILFHPNLFHCSNSNLSPYPRDTFIITYNSVNNLPTLKGKRPEYICSTNYEPLKSADALI